MDPVQFLEVQNYDLIFLPMGKIILKLLNKIPAKFINASEISIHFTPDDCITDMGQTAK